MDSTQAIVIHKSELPAYTSIGVVIGHLLAWGVFVGLPLIPILNQTEVPVWEHLSRHLILSIRSAVFFYLIYGVLIPRFLACGGLIRFFFTLGCASAFVSAGTVAIDSFLISQLALVPTSLNPHMSAWQGFVVNGIFNVTLGIIALAGRFTFDWFAISRAYHRYQIMRAERDFVGNPSENEQTTVLLGEDAAFAEVEPFDVEGNRESRQGSIWVRSGGENVRVDLDQLWYIEGMKDYVAYVGPWGKTLVHQRLKDAENGLPSREFRRVHRSFIVAWAHAEGFSNTFVRVAGREIPVGATYRGKF